ncbi:MAG TPA: YdiK family protein [Pseudogracilibacillus sp.]|nr:YdiK family protein [Pseudogracilibacillus sp.]
MRTGVVYFLLAALFIYLAVINATETIFNPLSLIMLAIAAIDIGLGITMLRTYLQERKEEK